MKNLLFQSSPRRMSCTEMMDLVKCASKLIYTGHELYHKLHRFDVARFRLLIKHIIYSCGNMQWVVPYVFRIRIYHRVRPLRMHAQHDTSLWFECTWRNANGHGIVFTICNNNAIYASHVSCCGRWRKQQAYKLMRILCWACNLLKMWCRCRSDLYTLSQLSIYIYMYY